MQKRNSLRARADSFRYACNGLKIFLREEPNAQIHLLALFAVLILSWALHLSAVEWILVLSVSALVIGLECINTAIENLADIVSPDWHPGIKKVKDLAAAGVWVVAILALLVGLIIFIPKIAALCSDNAPGLAG